MKCHYLDLLLENVKLVRKHTFIVHFLRHFRESYQWIYKQTYPIINIYDIAKIEAMSSLWILAKMKWHEINSWTNIFLMISDNICTDVFIPTSGAGATPWTPSSVYTSHPGVAHTPVQAARTTTSHPVPYHSCSYHRVGQPCKVNGVNLE